MLEQHGSHRSDAKLQRVHSVVWVGILIQVARMIFVNLFHTLHIQVLAELWNKNWQHGKNHLGKKFSYRITLSVNKILLNEGYC